MLEPNIHPIDWKSLEKGSSLTEEQIIEFHKYHFPDKKFDEFAYLRVRNEIQKLRTEINDPIVIKQEKTGENKTLKILTDKEAPSYLDSQATAGIRKQRKNARRLLTDIDTNNLNESERRKLETKQVHHAFIAAAADGARKHSLQTQRKGEVLPNSVIRKSKLIPPDT
jgi:hypothetical protein|tara:strand:+ start:2061 stop:2564 length:504 start_codon:yes stop_codon:yes gene_type:complete